MGWISKTNTAQKMKFSVKNFFSKCDQIHSFLPIWSHLLKKFLMESFVFVQAMRISKDYVENSRKCYRVLR